MTNATRITSAPTEEQGNRKKSRALQPKMTQNNKAKTEQAKKMVRKLFQKGKAASAAFSYVYILLII